MIRTSTETKRCRLGSPRAPMSVLIPIRMAGWVGYSKGSCVNAAFKSSHLNAVQTCARSLYVCGLAKLTAVFFCPWHSIAAGNSIVIT